MARYQFKLPDIGEGIAEAEIVAWHVKIGDMVEEDGRLADMMTDKATVEMESPVAGRIVEVAGEESHLGSVLSEEAGGLSPDTGAGSCDHDDFRLLVGHGLGTAAGGWGFVSEEALGFGDRRPGDRVTRRLDNRATGRH